MAVATTNTVILQPSKRLPYLEGDRLAKQVGGKRMPNFPMDKLLVSSDDYKKIESNLN